MKKLNLAHLNTPVEKLDRLTGEIRKLNSNCPEIYIKRDDFTGTELSGNKIRKLEYRLMEAKDKGCNLIITCGGIQSNHCRATAAIGAKLGLKVVLLLRGEESKKTGNYLMDELFSADIHYNDPSTIHKNIEEFFPFYENMYKEKGYKPYLIPTGASNAIGSFGYKDCMKEIIDLNGGEDFDAILVTVGSGGTYAGLLLGKEAYKYNGDVVGIPIAGEGSYFNHKVREIFNELNQTYLDQAIEIPQSWIQFIDGYQGRGYAINEPEDFDFIKKVAGLEGLLLDPVYTAKAMKGLVAECEKGTFNHYKKILFIHTGGIFGLLAKSNVFN